MPQKLAATLLLLLKVISLLLVNIHQDVLELFLAKIHFQILQLPPLLVAVVVEDVARVVVVLEVFVEAVDAELLFLLNSLLPLLMNTNLKLLVQSARDEALLWRKPLVRRDSLLGLVPKSDQTLLLSINQTFKTSRTTIRQR